MTSNAADQRFPALPELDGEDRVSALERIALGKLLTANDAVEHLLDLSVDDFAVPGHQHIYASIMAHADPAVDNTKVVADVMNVRAVRALGDPVIYLSRMRSEGIDAVGDYSFHASRVREASRLRAVRKAAEEAYRAAEQGDLDKALSLFEPLVRRGEDGEDGAADGPMTSWAPIDITPVLDGTRVQPTPELGRRHDGVPIFYRGKEHSVASEPECGKTWWLLLQVMHILQTGGRVVYIDFEDDESTIVGRLLLLGCLPSHLTPTTFRYIRPEVKPSPAVLRRLLDFGDGLHADFVVFDGVTEGMSLLGMEINDQESAAAWRRVFIKPALRVGAATISTDHVVKNKDARGRFAIGAQHKLAGLNGVMFLMESVRPFGAGIKPRSVDPSGVLVGRGRGDMGGLRAWLFCWAGSSVLGCFVGG